MFLSIPATHWLFGLMTRYRDDSNYHYVTLRNCNTLEIKAGGISGAGFAIKCAGLIAGTTYSTRPNGTFVSAPRFGWGGWQRCCRLWEEPRAMRLPSTN